MVRQFVPLLVAALAGGVAAVPVPEPQVIFTPVPNPTRAPPSITPPAVVVSTAVTFTPIRPTIAIPSDTRVISTAVTFTPIRPTIVVPSSSRIISTAVTLSPIKPVETKCVQGRGVRVGTYDIDYNLVTAPEQFPRGEYRISSDWEKQHQIGTMSMTIGTSMADYGEFRCQYTCNSMQNCVSFAGWAIGSSFECHLYDALIPSSVFTRVGFGSATRTIHSFNRLCRANKLKQKRDSIFSKEGAWRCHGEYCCSSEVACPISSDCAELGLIEAKPEKKWENYFLQGDWVLQNRWAGFVNEVEFSESNLKRVEGQCKMACIQNLGKCTGFTIAYGLPDPDNAYPEFSMSSEPERGFICNLLSQKIAASEFREAKKADTWTHFKGYDVGCTSSLI